MIKIVAKNYVREGCTADFEKLAAQLIEGSRKEEGNVFYTLNKSTEDPLEYCFIECWKDQAAISSHNASPHFTSLVPEMAKLLSKPSPAELFEELDL